MAEKKSTYVMSFLRWRAFGMIVCLILWATLFSLRIFLTVILPPILMYPIMGVIAVALLSKFFAFIGRQDNKHILISPVVGFTTFIIILTGSVLWLGIAAALALSGMTQYLVRFAYTNRQYNTYIAYGLFAVVLLATAISVFCYFTSGAFLPTYAAILVINLFSVCFYFLNHPTMFEHCKELQSFLVISMDFFALSILFHSCYIPICIFFPSMFTLSIGASLTYLFHAISLALLTVFVMRPAPEEVPKASDDEHKGFVAEGEKDNAYQDNEKYIPSATVEPSAPVLVQDVDAVPAFSLADAWMPIARLVNAHTIDERRTTPSAPEK